jgi:hypothetical protein
MGAWGGGLYDDDFGRDLRAVIKGVWRAPISDHEILAEIGAPTPCGQDDLNALDHWLVLADQLERAGMPKHAVFDRAIAIIEAGQDLAALEALGSGKAVLAKRRKVHVDLLRRLRNPRPAKQRRPLSKPQPLLFEENDGLAWPTDKGRCINPYVPEDKLHRLGGFTQDGWGFGIVTSVGHLYGVLAFHSVQALKWRRPERPSTGLAAQCPRSEHHYGTMTPIHFKRLKLERLGLTPSDALGPPQDSELALTMSRKAALENIGLSRAFDWDAFNKSVGPGPKFMFSAPSPVPLDPHEPDQRPGPFSDRNEFSPLPPDEPATRDYYLNRMRAQTEVP